MRNMNRKSPTGGSQESRLWLHAKGMGETKRIHPSPTPTL